MPTKTTWFTTMIVSNFINSYPTDITRENYMIIRFAHIERSLKIKPDACASNVYYLYVVCMV